MLFFDLFGDSCFLERLPFGSSVCFGVERCLEGGVPSQHSHHVLSQLALKSQEAQTSQLNFGSDAQLARQIGGESFNLVNAIRNARVDSSFPFLQNNSGVDTFRLLDGGDFVLSESGSFFLEQFGEVV